MNARLLARPDLSNVPIDSARFRPFLPATRSPATIPQSLPLALRIRNQTKTKLSSYSDKRFGFNPNQRTPMATTQDSGLSVRSGLFSSNPLTFSFQKGRGGAGERRG